MGVQYISWMSFHSLSALENLYDEANLLKYMEEEALESLHQETHASRTIVGQELLISEAFTLDDPFISDPGKRPYFVLGFMDPKPGKEDAYRRIEIDIFVQPLSDGHSRSPISGVGRSARPLFNQARFLQEPIELKTSISIA